ncbi:MAG: hypothetical protein ACK4M7_10400, partial [Burkholderiales bacterium]
MPAISFNLALNQLKRQEIAKLLPSTDSLCLASLQQQLQVPLLIIANDGYSTSRLLEEIRFFAPQLKVASFPDLEMLPFERAAPQKELTAERLRVLWQISLGQLDIVIVQANTLQTRLCPKEYLDHRVLILKVGDKLSLSELRTKLLSSNYSLVEQVYEAGEFAIRGGVVDIMPMGCKQLIRLDLFDDEIESLKLLESKTKQLVKTVTSFELIPTREYPIDEISLKRFTAKFGERFPASQNLALLRELKHGILPAGSDFY